MSRTSGHPDTDTRAGGARWATTAVPAAVALLTIVAFADSLRNHFVDWDDPINFTDNYAFRGLGWPQLRWCWTATLLGVYQPVSWMFAGLVSAVGGVRPVAFHAANLILHTVAAVVFWFVTVRLLRLAMPAREAKAGVGLQVCAGLGAAAFAVHPLRVETVAWATCQPYTLAVLFSLLTIAAYLKAHRPSVRARARRAWLAAAVLLCVMALLSKAAAVALPAILLVLDVFPLRRVGGSRSAWLGSRARAVYAEKLLFVLPAAVVAVMAAWASQSVEPVLSLEQHGVPERLAAAAYGLAFGVTKTVFPLPLLPYYPMPAELHPLEARFVLSGILVVGVTAFAIALRRRWPGLLAVWIAYVAALIPVVGIVQHGLQLAADRYSLLSCLGWPVLIAAGMLRWWPTGSGNLAGRGRPAGYALVVAGCVATVALAFLTWRQTTVWHDSHALWSHAVEQNPRCHFSHRAFAKVLMDEGRYQEAIAHCRRAIELNPGYVPAHSDLGLALFRLGRVDEAIESYRRALALSPTDSTAHNNLGVALEAKGRLDEAVEHYRRALQSRPDYAEAHNNLGSALFKQGRAAEAEAQYRMAIMCKPTYAKAHNNLGVALKARGRVEEAIRHYRLALRYQPAFPEAQNNLGNALFKTGNLTEAEKHYRLALKHDPEYAEAHYNLGLVLMREGRVDDAIRSIERALELRPDYPEARRTLARARRLPR